MQLLAVSERRKAEEMIRRVEMARAVTPPRHAMGSAHTSPRRVIDDVMISPEPKRRTAGFTTWSRDEKPEPGKIQPPPLRQEVSLEFEPDVEDLTSSLLGSSSLGSISPRPLVSVTAMAPKPAPSVSAVSHANSASNMEQGLRVSHEAVAATSSIARAIEEASGSDTHGPQAS